jgi:hypothetical protein
MMNFVFIHGKASPGSSVPFTDVFSCIFPLFQVLRRASLWQPNDPRQCATVINLKVGQGKVILGKSYHTQKKPKPPAHPFTSLALVYAFLDVTLIKRVARVCPRRSCR